MLDGGNAGIAFGNYRSPACLHYVLSQCIDYVFTLKVDALEFVTVVFRSGIKCSFYF